jgi:hypothetical protein
MGFVLIFIAVILIITALRGTTGQLGSLLMQDFTGKNNFGIWLFAFFLIGALGYIPSFKKLSDAFLLLVIVVILISNDKNGQGFFTELTAAMNGAGSGSLPATPIGGLASSTPTLSLAPFNPGNVLASNTIGQTALGPTQY